MSDTPNPPTGNPPTGNPPTGNPPDHPQVIAPPPLLYLGGLLAGWLLNLVLPLPILAGPPVAVSMALIVAALGLAGWCVLLMTRAGTKVQPHQPTTAIVTDGPYRLSRNPIYVALTMLSVGVALWGNSYWMLGLLIPTFVLMNIAVIDPEERYLERKFGAEYLAYKNRVRRWV